MNQHEEFKEKPVVDPVTGQPMLPTQGSDEPLEPRRRSNWPIVIILLAGLVLALIAWLPAELSRDSAQPTVPPVTTDQPAGQPTTDTTGQTTPPADTQTQPAPGATPQQGTQTPETQGSTPGTTPAMTQPAQ
ncbi:MAG TPA: hypothetical protein VGO04_07850 [Ensifer sp.]|uniref:hypothetical protein n=1 Tax=Ensifer sp. TaxID=1872086 RepID=UPI002E14B8CE|nr:hypothetical protein [Ensifer sp.]